MNKLFSKSSKGLLENSSINFTFQFGLIKAQNRALRADLQDVKLMLNKLLIEKHLQMQVDDYYESHDSDGNSKNSEDSSESL